jgi:hypothetical protein
MSSAFLSLQKLWKRFRHLSATFLRPFDTKRSEVAFNGGFSRGEAALAGQRLNRIVFHFLYDTVSEPRHESVANIGAEGSLQF